jgi:hypothetical protein
MHPPHYTGTRQELYRCAATVRQPHRWRQDQNPKGTVTMLPQILRHAAVPLCSLHATYAQWRDTPGDQAVRDTLAALRSVAKTLEQQGSFAEQLPKAMKRRCWRLAIDLNLHPYQG